MERKTIVITGSTRGIGLGLAKEFLKAGHQVVINGRSKESINTALEKLKQYNTEITGVPGSVDQEATHQSLVNHAVKLYGKIDIWINNAGIPQPHLIFTEIGSSDIRGAIDTNIYGLLMGTKIATNQMLKQGFGAVFNMEGFGSDGRNMKKLTLYGTTKRAVNYFTKALAREMKGSPVRICVLSPGMVRTEFLTQSMMTGTPEERRQFDKVYRLLAEDVEVVTPFLVKGILNSKRNYDRIRFLSGGRLFVRLVKLVFA